MEAVQRADKPDRRGGQQNEDPDTVKFKHASLLRPPMEGNLFSFAPKFGFQTFQQLPPNQAERPPQKGGKDEQQLLSQTTPSITGTVSHLGGGLLMSPVTQER